MSVTSISNVFGWLGNQPRSGFATGRVAPDPRAANVFSVPAATAGSSQTMGTNSATASPGVGIPREWGWEASGLRAEIKINGEVVGRVYNNGAVELADDYAELGKQLGWGDASEAELKGPELADKRIAQALAALKSAGAKVEFAVTALTQEQWLASFSSAIGRNLDRSI